MSNVIVFPKGKKDTPPQSMEELLENVESTRKEHIEYVMDEVLSYVFSRVYDDGFDLGDEECLKTTALLVESMRSALYKTAGIFHAFHVMAEDVFNIVDAETNESVDILSENE